MSDTPTNQLQPPGSINIDYASLYDATQMLSYGLPTPGGDLFGSTMMISAVSNIAQPVVLDAWGNHLKQLYPDIRPGSTPSAAPSLGMLGR